MHLDTIMFAEEMNQYHQLDPGIQFDFYFHAIRQGRRFGFPPKPEEHTHLELVADYFGYSRQKAVEALRLLTLEDIQDIMAKNDKGGNS